MTQQPTPFVLDERSSDEADTSIERTVPSETRTPLYLATNSARYQRQEIIKQIQERTERPLVCYVSGIRCGIDRDDILPFFDILHNVMPGESAELLLHTPGGSADVAEKLIRTLRGRVGEAQIHIIVPDFAKSAGTLMVLGADRVVMSDMSELGPIDPQMLFKDSTGQVRWQPVQNYLDAYDDYVETLTKEPDNLPARIMLDRLDPVIVKLWRSARDRARQSAENLLKIGMFRDNDGNWSRTASELLDTRRWLSHSQMISWQDAQDPHIGLVVDHLHSESDRWQDYWRLYCLQRLAVGDNQKLFESERASLVIDGPTG
jgi:hypothetical protein